MKRTYCYEELIIGFLIPSLSNFPACVILIIGIAVAYTPLSFHLRYIVYDVLLIVDRFGATKTTQMSRRGSVRAECGRGGRMGGALA